MLKQAWHQLSTDERRSDRSWARQPFLELFTLGRMYDVVQARQLIVAAQTNTQQVI